MLEATRPAVTSPLRNSLLIRFEVGLVALARSSQSEPHGTIDLARLISDLLDAGDAEIYRKLTLAVDRIVLHVVLRHTKGNQVQASELLGISRTTLRAKLRSCGLGVEKQLLSDSEI